MHFIVTWFSPGIPVSLPNVEYEALSLLFPTVEKRKDTVVCKREGEVLHMHPRAPTLPGRPTEVRSPLS